MTRVEKAGQLRELAQERILVKDGPYGSMIQSYRLDEAGFRGGRSFELDQKGNNDLLNLTRPDVVSEICNAYLGAGADIVATNPSPTPSAQRLRHRGPARDQHGAARHTRACADATTARDPTKRACGERPARPTRRCRSRPTSTTRVMPSPSTR
jgi:5-methyltetrahydrofolate--homocysteine methyltransferase